MRNLWTWLLFGVITIAVFVLIWGILIEPYQLVIHEETVRIPGLPDKWDTQQIGVISDFQIGMWGDNERTVRKAVSRLVEIEPAVVLVLGDFVYHATQNQENDVKISVEMLKPLIDAGIPVFAVLGNHDYQVVKIDEEPNQDLAHRLEEELENLGVTLLKNENQALELENGSQENLFIVGVGSHLARQDNPVSAFSSLPENAPRILMMHNPASFETIPSNSSPLAVAGHTHGGQIRIPFTPEWSMLTYVKSEPVHVDGWIKDFGKPGNRLYVNRGIGFSIIPVRINCPPEITLFTLEQ